MRWSLFCRVVDNFGDIGFTWRLASDLAGRGEDVRLVVDDASALAWMAPAGAPGVEVAAWQAAAAATSDDVLVETFGCELPDRVAADLSTLAEQPVRVNVEHLSAEAFAARSHGLPSPRFTADGEPLTTWYFYPGFTPETGGLLREPGLLRQRQDFGDGRAWLAARGIARGQQERCVSLFCYRNAAVDALLDAFAAAPTLLLLTPGPATEQALALLGPERRRGELRAVALPALSQPEFDRLLWSCEFNFVRGEDSLVRALWAGVPFVWQAYVQDDRAHAAKVEAFLDWFLADAPAGLASELRRLFAAWNGLLEPGPGGSMSLPDAGEWTRHCRLRRDQLAAQQELTSALLDFVASKR